ncbi:MAG: hypothetical protein HFI09_04465 [Bacilli bacterium]|nr:hypothetical protein [Bacilli bacterium]
MQQLSIDERRLSLFRQQKDIYQNKMNSIYFDEFLEIGFMDFLLLSYSNQQAFPNQEYILECFEKGKNYHHFLELFCTQSKVSMDEFINTLYSAMYTFYSTNLIMRIHMLHITHLWNNDYLASIPCYTDYVFEYAVNAKGWIAELDVIIDTVISQNSKDLFIVSDFFKQQMNYFPENIRHSILINIGLELGIVFFDPKKRLFNEQAFIQWLGEEIKRKKAQQRAKISGN